MKTLIYIYAVHKNTDVGLKTQVNTGPVQIKDIA